MSFVLGLLVGGVICGLTGVWMGVNVAIDQIERLRNEARAAKRDRDRMRGELVKAKNALARHSRRKP